MAVLCYLKGYIGYLDTAFKGFQFKNAYSPVIKSQKKSEGMFQKVRILII